MVTRNSEVAGLDTLTANFSFNDHKKKLKTFNKLLLNKKKIRKIDRNSNTVNIFTVKKKKNGLQKYQFEFILIDLNIKV